MAAPKHLLFPVESPETRLDCRLALAVESARPDNRVYIGRHEVLMHLARRLKGGVFLGNTAVAPPHNGADGTSKQPFDDYHLLKDRGFVVVHFDFETPPGDPDSARNSATDRNFDPRQLDGDDFVCTWGDLHRDVYTRLDPPCRSSIRTTGGPHFDLYRHKWHKLYEDDVRRLRADYGDFLLVTTRLFRANGRADDTDLFDGDDRRRRNGRFEAVQRWTREKKKLSYVARLVHRLQTVFPDIDVVIRPHRLEDPSLYRILFRGLPSVHVRRRGPLAPWILGARCLIHDGSESGLAAHLADTPLIHFCPLEDSPLETMLPRQFGVRCDHEDDVVECLVELLHADGHRTCFDDPTIIDHRARRLVDNLCGDAFPAMLSVLAEAQARVGDTAMMPKIAVDAEQKLFDLVGRLKKSAPVVGSRTNSPGSGFDDVSSRLRQLQQLTDRDVDHHLIGDRLLVVESP